VDQPKSDWRIGLKVKPKYRVHPFFGKTGQVFEVDEATDVVSVLMDTSGAVLTEPSDNFVTAGPSIDDSARNRMLLRGI
jgi:hypothetical protein